MCKRLISLVIFMLVVGMVSNAWADLVYRFEFEGNANEMANGYNGTEMGTGVAYTAPGAYVSGSFLNTLINHDLAFDVSRVDQSYIEAPNTGWPLGEEMTLTFYAKMDSYGGDGAFQGHDIDGDPEQRGVSVSTWHEGVYFDVVGSGDRVSTSPSLEGAWYHYAFTHNTYTNSMKAYLNGVLVMENNDLLHVTDGVDVLYIGQLITYWAGVPNAIGYWDGMIDDLRIYDEELDASVFVDMARTSFPNRRQ